MCAGSEIGSSPEAIISPNPERGNDDSGSRINLAEEYQ